jgi:hypothetical protein
MAETEDSGNWLYQHELVLLGGIFFGSVITMIAASRACDTESQGSCENNNAFAVSVGVISLVFVGFHLVTHFYAKDLHNRLTPAIGAFLAIWWLVGVGSSTFESPFKVVGNGYMAMWLSFSLSMYYVTLAVPKVGELFLLAEDRLGQKIEVKMMAALAPMNVVVLVAALVECNDSGKSCSDEYGWVIVCSCLSLLLALVFLPCHGRLNDLNVTKYLGLFLVVWWAFGAGVATFDKPFLTAGNGWFGCWGSFTVSVLFTAQTYGVGLFDAGNDAPSDEAPADVQTPTIDGEPKLETANV